jgi:hypothetical protein
LGGHSVVARFDWWTGFPDNHRSLLSWLLKCQGIQFIHAAAARAVVGKTLQSSDSQRSRNSDAIRRNGLSNAFPEGSAGNPPDSSPAMALADVKRPARRATMFAGNVRVWPGLQSN